MFSCSLIVYHIRFTSCVLSRWERGEKLWHCRVAINCLKGFDLSRWVIVCFLFDTPPLTSCSEMGWGLGGREGVREVEGAGRETVGETGTLWRKKTPVQSSHMPVTAVHLKWLMVPRSDGQSECERLLFRESRDGERVGLRQVFNTPHFSNKKDRPLRTSEWFDPSQLSLLSVKQCPVLSCSYFYFFIIYFYLFRGDQLRPGSHFQWCPDDIKDKLQDRITSALH